MPRRALFLITVLVLALHWLVLSGVPLAWDNPGSPVGKVFRTRSIAAPPPPAAAVAAVAAVAPVAAQPAVAPQPPPRPPPPAPATPPPPARLAAPAGRAFEVSGQARKFAQSARAELRWEHDGSRYEARQEISAF